jgi:hypothetical protein
MEETADPYTDKRIQPGPITFDTKRGAVDSGLQIGISEGAVQGFQRASNAYVEGNGRCPALPGEGTCSSDCL